MEVERCLDSFTQGNREKGGGDFPQPLLGYRSFPQPSLSRHSKGNSIFRESRLARRVMAGRGKQSKSKANKIFGWW